jgi:hypothetical protein
MRNSISIVATLAVAACGGGGGGGGGDSFLPSGVTPIPFTSFSALGPNEVVDLEAGDAREGAIVVDADGNVVGLDPQQRVAASLQLRTDDDIAFDALRLFVDGRRITIDSNDPNVSIVSDPDDVLLIVQRETDDALDLVALVEPGAIALDHLTFGFWASGGVEQEALLGVGAFGALTDATDVPTTGTARYEGALVGIAILGGETVDGVAAEVALDANFATAEIAFASSGTESEIGPVPALDMAGDLAIAGERFAGTGTTAGGLTGPVEGSFYGPAAVEAGGVFDLGGLGGDRFTGSFGARQ